MKKIFTVLLVLLIASNCVNEKSQKYLIHFDGYLNDTSLLPLSSIFKNTRFIRLQLSDNSLIGRQIGKIKKYNDQYYISCDYKELLVFDKNGNFLQKMNTQGAGHEEYTTLKDYDIAANGDIIILDLKKLHRYGNDRVLKESVPLTITGFNIKIINDNYLICASGEDYSVYLIDKEGHVLEKYLKTNSCPTIGRITPFIPFGSDSIIFQSGYSNSVLCYDTKSMDFSEINLLSGNTFLNEKEEKKLKDRYGPDYLDYVINSDIIGGISAYNDYLLFTAGNRNDGFKCFLFNAQTKNIQYILTEKNVDDISFTDTYSLLGHLDKSDANDCFITYIYMDALMNGLKNETKHKENDHYASLVNQFKDIENPEDENPVLIEFTIQ